jgi:hypothetical protein
MSLLDDIQHQVVVLATQTINIFKDDAIKDVNAFLHESEADLTTWGQQTAAGTLTPDDVEFLIKGKMDLAKMAFLQKAGIAAVQLDTFKNGVLKIVVNSLLKLIPS